MIEFARINGYLTGESSGRREEAIKQTRETVSYKYPDLEYLNFVQWYRKPRLREHKKLSNGRRQSSLSADHVRAIP